ncbi:MAG: sulfite exporter TauE/SafE family protein [Chloroflexi bacterium]|nr:sulfite exporter TauE/SafE family protein [Chloroflexota bacterium]
MDWVAVVAFVVFGLAVGAYGTLIGAGGGFIVVPVLVLGLGWPHQQAVATSLFVVTANAASGSASYLRQKRVDIRTGLQFAAATIPGAVIGSYLVQLLSGRVFNIIFGIVLVIVSSYLMLRPGKPESHNASTARPEGLRGWGWTVRHIVDARGQAFDYGFPKGWGILLSFGVGFMSSILGIGGGIIHVPALVTLFDFPAHVATATSHFVLVFSTATGTIVQLFNGNVRLGEAISMSVGAVIGAQIGGELSHRVKGQWIVRGLAAALTLVGIRLIIG